MALGGKLNHFGLEKSQIKSTVLDATNNSDNKFCEESYFSLANRCQRFLPDSRTFRLTFEVIQLMKPEQ